VEYTASAHSNRRHPAAMLTMIRLIPHVEGCREEQDEMNTNHKVKQLDNVKGLSPKKKLYGNTKSVYCG